MSRWFDDLAALAARGEALVIVTVLRVRGHAPREAGAKMLVTAEAVHGTIGGGNLEDEAVKAARAMLSGGAREIVTTGSRLTERERGLFAQCCGGEVELLFEPVETRRPTVAIFGVGHVGLALARVLSVFPIDLVLVDSRESMLDEARLAPARHGPARVRVELAPILDPVVPALPPGAHLLVMTHDHAEDLCVVEMALRRDDLGMLGLIGSRAKWQTFRRRLRENGMPEEKLARVTTPIGLAGVKGKAPEVIAVAVAAQLVPLLSSAAPSVPNPVPRGADVVRP